MTHLRIEFLFGVGFDKLGNPIPKSLVESTIPSVLSAMVAKFGGCTLSSTFGGWRGPNGTTVVEVGYSAVAIVPCDPNFMDQYDGDINEIRAVLTSLFNQHSVLAVKSMVELIDFLPAQQTTHNT